MEIDFLQNFSKYDVSETYKFLEGSQKQIYLFLENQVGDRASIRISYDKTNIYITQGNDIAVNPIRSINLNDFSLKPTLVEDSERIFARAKEMIRGESLSNLLN